MNRQQANLLALGIQAAFNGLVFWSIGSIGVTLTTAVVAVMAYFGPAVHTSYGDTGMVLYIIGTIAIAIGSLFLTAYAIKRAVII